MLDSGPPIATYAMVAEDLLNQAREEEDINRKRELLEQSEKLVLKDDRESAYPEPRTLHAEILLELASIADTIEEEGDLQRMALGELVNVKTDMRRAWQKEIQDGIIFDEVYEDDLGLAEDLFHDVSKDYLHKNPDKVDERYLTLIALRGMDLLPSLEARKKKDKTLNGTGRAYHRFARLLHHFGQRLRDLSLNDRPTFYTLDEVVENLELERLLDRIVPGSDEENREQVRKTLGTLFTKGYNHAHDLERISTLQNLAISFFKISGNTQQQLTQKLYLAKANLELAHANYEAGMLDIAAHHALLAKRTIGSAKVDTIKRKIGNLGKDEGKVLTTLAQLNYMEAKLGTGVERLEANVEAVEALGEYIYLRENPYTEDGMPIVHRKDRDPDEEAEILLAKSLDHLARSLMKTKPNRKLKRRLRSVFGLDRESFDVETIIDEALQGGTLVMEQVLDNGNRSADLMSRLGEMHYITAKRGTKQWARNMFTYAFQHIIQSGLVDVEVDVDPDTGQCYWYEIAENLGYDLGLAKLSQDIYETLREKHDLYPWQEINIIVEKTLKHLEKEGLLDVNHIGSAGVIARLPNDEIVKDINEEHLPLIGESLRRAVTWLKRSLEMDDDFLAPMDFLREIADEISDDTKDMFEISLEPEYVWRQKLMHTIRTNGELVADRMTRRKGGAIIQHGPLRDNVYAMPVSPLEERVTERLRREGIAEYIPTIRCHDEGLGLWEHYGYSLFEIGELNLAELRSLELMLNRSATDKQKDKIKEQIAAKRANIDGRYSRATDNMFPINDTIHAVIDPKLFGDRVYKSKLDYIKRTLKTFFGSEYIKTTENVTRKAMMMMFVNDIVSQLESQIRWGYKDMNPGNIGGREPLMGDWEGLKPVTHYTEDLAIMLGFVYPLIESGNMSEWVFPEVHSRDREDELLARFHENWHGERREKYAQVKWDRFLMDYAMADLAKKLNLIGHEHYKLRKRIPLLDKEEKKPRWHDHCVYASEWYRAVAIRNMREAIDRPEFRKGYDREKRALEAFATMLETVEFIYPERQKDTGLVIVESGLVREDY